MNYIQILALIGKINMNLIPTNLIYKIDKYY